MTAILHSSRSLFTFLSFFLALFLFISFAHHAGGAEPASKYFYDKKGQVIREEVDSTGSGRIDTWVTYQDGRPFLQAVDTNQDGKPDAWYHALALIARSGCACGRAGTKRWPVQLKSNARRASRTRMTSRLPCRMSFTSCGRWRAS